MNSKNWTAGERRKFATNMRHFGGNILTGFVVTKLIMFTLAIIGMSAAAYAVTSGGSEELILAAAPIIVPAEVKDGIVQALKAIKDLGEKYDGELGTMREDIKGIEREILQSKRFADAGHSLESIGHTIVNSAEFKDFAQSGQKQSPLIKIGTFHKTALLNAAVGSDNPLVAPHRIPGIVAPGQRRLRMRDIIPTLPITSNMVEFGKETAFDNQAASQGAGSSPNVRENVAKPESGFTFTLDKLPVETIAHWLPVSRQLISDAPGLQAYINARLTYGLKVKEEDQIVNGDESDNTLAGLIDNSTAYDTGDDKVGDNRMDTLRHAIRQVDDSDFEASAIVLNPVDWELIELTKTFGSGIDSGQYLITNPKAAGTPTLWGLPVVISKALAAGNFLVGAFDQAAILWDRMDASVAVSLEHSDFFIKNMAAILCEERVALTVLREEAIIFGSFAQGDSGVIEA